MIFRVSALARARGAAIARRQMSSEVSTASGGGLNAFARGWYNLYVRAKPGDRYGDCPF